MVDSQIGDASEASAEKAAAEVKKSNIWDKNGIPNTIFIAAAVCLVCSLLVSTAAVMLKKMQDENVVLDMKRNILLATGDFSPSDLTSRETVNEAFKDKVTDQIIDLTTGEDVTDEYTADATDASRAKAIANFQPEKLIGDKDDATSTALSSAENIAKIKDNRVEKRAHVYVYEDATGEKKYIFPIRGYGLWSTLKGFFALKSDLKTVAGITYYEHKETPGLGGEVDNPVWKAQWPGKQLTSEGGEIQLSVVTPQSDEQFKVDGLSGATITSRGVENMVHFWMGKQGFGNFIEKQRNASSPSLREGSRNQPSRLREGREHTSREGHAFSPSLWESRERGTSERGGLVANHPGPLAQVDPPRLRRPSQREGSRKQRSSQSEGSSNQPSLREGSMTTAQGDTDG